MNAPSSWHDSRVAKAIYENLHVQTPDGFFLVADTAFPHGNDQIKGRIRTPMKEGMRLPADLVTRTEVLAYDRQLLSFRQSAEWGNGTLQRVFARLQVPLTLKYTRNQVTLLEACIHLCNLRTRHVGLNQIQTVYVPLWKGDNMEVWRSFEDILFADLRQNDRVRRFHLTSEW